MQAHGVQDRAARAEPVGGLVAREVRELLAPPCEPVVQQRVAQAGRRRVGAVGQPVLDDPAALVAPRAQPRDEFRMIAQVPRPPAIVPERRDHQQHRPVDPEVGQRVPRRPHLGLERRGHVVQLDHP